MIATAEKKWLVIPMEDETVIEALAKELGCTSVIARLLFIRNIRSRKEREDFFNVTADKLHSPMLMKDMEEAVNRIIRAIVAKEKILLVGDYDVDGTTATALSFQYLRSLEALVEYYIPDRFKEGYGVSEKSIQYAADNGVKLMISLDCGIKANDRVAEAAQHGIDFIICDHHQPGSELPPAIAVLDPKREDCDYPYKELSGCGLAFKLMHALAGKCRTNADEVMDYLDLVATSIAADIVPMTGENRILMKLGLDKINKNPCLGIKAIMENAGPRKVYEVSDIVFKIAPRINSAGRMESGRQAVELLIADDSGNARQGIETIAGLNERRRTADRDITESALKMIEEDTQFQSRKTTVIFDPSWNKGVIGIVAARLIEHYYRPTIVFTKSEGKLCGSARSVRNFNLYAALEKSSEHLIQFGGHMYAAGMTLEEDKYEDFRNAFDKAVSGMIREEHLSPVIEIDAEIKLSDINMKFYDDIRNFSPFGPGNMEPLFLTKNVVISRSRVVGNTDDGGHLSLQVTDPENDRIVFNVIGFRMGDRLSEAGIGVMADLVYKVEKNIYNGRTSIQFVMRDFRT